MPKLNYKTLRQEVVDEIRQRILTGDFQAGERIKENEMAQQLIRSMTKPFAPERYHDEYQARLRDAIEQKIRGQQITQVKRSSAHTSSLDLMEALQRSVTAAQTSVKKRRVRH